MAHQNQQPQPVQEEGGKTMSLDRIISVVAIVLSLGSATYSGLSKQNSLEYLTKADFNVFQIENVRKMTSLENTVQSGFANVTQQLSSLNFATTKEFLELKDKSTASAFDLQKQIDFVKKDIDAMQRSIAANLADLSQLKTRLAILESEKRRE